MADYDYISARTLFRQDCITGFLLLAQQAIEKYLKAILLFNKLKTKNDHDLEILANCCKRIKHFEIDKETNDFIKEINHADTIRYLTYSTSFHGPMLLNFDKAVWDIRKFAQNDTETIIKLKKIKPDNIHKVHYVIFSGKLEKVINEENKQYKLLRTSLIWNNTFFSKKKVKILSANRFWAKIPPYFSGSDSENVEVYEAIKDYVYLPKDIINYFEDLKIKYEKLKEKEF
jgi:hypothetical protein